jgi:hypothetical protein
VHYRIGDQEFLTPEQLLSCHDDGKLQELLQDENSTLLIWIQGYFRTTGYIETLEAFIKAVVSNGMDIRKRILLSHVIAAIAVQSEELPSLVSAASILRTVYPAHPLLKNISDSISEKTEQLRKENKLIADANCLSASKPKAELFMLLLIPPAISSLPFFKITPQPLIDICHNSYQDGAACYLAGMMLVIGALIYADYRKMGIIGWLTCIGIVIMLAANFPFAQWALVLLLSFFPASVLFAALFTPILYLRWNRASNFSKSAHQNQLLFSDRVRFDAYRGGVAKFRSSFSGQLLTDSINSGGSGVMPSVPDLESIATQVGVPERSIHLPMFLLRGVGLLAASSALILSAKVYYNSYDIRMKAISATRMQARTEIATTKSEATMRLSASGKSKKVTTISKGATVKILDQNNEWTHVRYKDFEGYIKSSLLQQNK